jgi:HrpA-like RNA helicase
MTSSNINLPEFFEDDFYDFSKDTLLIGKLFKKFNKELKKIKQEKESLILQLSESHVLIDSLKSENSMLFDTVDALENKLKESEDLLEKFSSNNLKSMLCIHTDISNKPDLIINDLSTSTSHASDSELYFIDIKPVIEDTACLDNSCLTNYMMPNSKESGIQGKFIPKCHSCGKIGHIRPNCYLLKSHRPWIKQDAKKTYEVGFKVSLTADAFGWNGCPIYVMAKLEKSNIIG